MAHALTALRLLCAAPFAWLMAQPGPGAARAAGVLIVIAIVTDLLDGPVARRTRGASARGRVFDHTTDFVFVTAGLFGGAASGAVPFVLPALIVVAFTQYVIDSYWLHRERELRMSALGRWNGILYFVPLCVEVGVRVGLATDLGLGWLGSLVPWIAWALVATTVASIADRAFAVSRRARGSPVAGR